MNGLDTSTAILLRKAGILIPAVTHLNLVITGQVQTELMNGSKLMDAYSSLRVIPCEEPAERRPFGPGELSLLILYESGLLSALFSDDGAFLKYCRKHGIPHYPALMVPLLLFRNEVISRKEALSLFETIQDLGRYSEKIISTARKYW